MQNFDLHQILAFMDSANNLRNDQVPTVQPKAAASEQPNLPGSSAAPPLDADDWRAQLPPYSRQRVVNQILETLKKRVGFYEQEGLEKLKKIAERFEEKIYSAATSQSDYLRKISLKMLTMATNTKEPGVEVSSSQRSQ